MRVCVFLIPRMKEKKVDMFPTSLENNRMKQIRVSESHCLFQREMLAQVIRMFPCVFPGSITCSSQPEPTVTAPPSATREEPSGGWEEIRTASVGGSRAKHRLMTFWFFVSFYFFPLLFKYSAKKLYFFCNQKRNFQKAAEKSDIWIFFESLATIKMLVFLKSQLLIALLK